MIATPKTNSVVHSFNFIKVYHISNDFVAKLSLYKVDLIGHVWQVCSVALILTPMTKLRESWQLFLMLWRKLLCIVIIKPLKNEYKTVCDLSNQEQLSSCISNKLTCGSNWQHFTVVFLPFTALMCEV